MKKTLSILLFVLSAIVSPAQGIDLKWSETFIYDNKKDGFFDAFVGSNSEHVYAKFSNMALSPGKKNKKIKLVAFDKKTMKKTGEAELKGYRGKDTEDLWYYKTVAVNGQVYVFWTKESKSVVEVYVQSFDERLRKVNGIKKVYEVTRGTRSVAADKLFIIYNNDLKGKILLAKEYGVNSDGENLRIEYKLMNTDFSFISARQVTLPILMDKRRRGLFSSYSNTIHELACSYTFGDDGRLYVEDKVAMSNEEKAGLKKGEASVYPNVMQVDLTNGDVRSYRVKYPKKNTFGSSIVATASSVKIYGFFSDLDKDEKGNDTHGTFFVNMNSEDFTPKDTKFSYFTKSFLDELYAADKENQKKGRGLFKSNKAKASDDESIDDNYRVEQVVTDGDDILLFCSIMRNWERTVCTSNGRTTTCNTYYYCTKSNVTAFRLNQRGEILWAKNLDRSITYNNWNIYDLSVMKSNDSYYVLYGSAYQMNAKKKNNRSKKSGEQMTDRLEYAVFQGKTGDYQKFEKQINPLNARKSDKKLISPTTVEVFDNIMYAPSSRVRLKPGIWFACLCPPVFYGLLYSGNSRIGKGQFATITPLN